MVLCLPSCVEQRKPEEHAITIEDSLASRTPSSYSSSSTSSSSSRMAKHFSHTPPPPLPPPPKASTPSQGVCPSSRQSPCYHSPSRRPHPLNPLNPAPSPAATAPRSPALSPAPSHHGKGVERGSERGEGQPPQDYPQSLEPGGCFELVDRLMRETNRWVVIHILQSAKKSHRSTNGHGGLFWPSSAPVREKKLFKCL